MKRQFKLISSLEKIILASIPPWAKGYIIFLSHLKAAEVHGAYPAANYGVFFVDEPLFLRPEPQGLLCNHGLVLKIVDFHSPFHLIHSPGSLVTGFPASILQNAVYPRNIL